MGRSPDFHEIPGWTEESTGGDDFAWVDFAWGGLRMGSDAGFGIGGQGFLNSSDAIVNLCILEPRTFCPLDQVSRTIAVTQSKILRKLRQRRRGVSPTQVGRYIATARRVLRA